MVGIHGSHERKALEKQSQKSKKHQYSAKDNVVTHMGVINYQKTKIFDSLALIMYCKWFEIVNF